MKLFRYLIAVIMLGLILGTTGIAEANYRGPFKGKVVDADTGEPMAGVVVFIVWRVHHMWSMSSFFDTADVLTDENGKFDIPSKWSWNPLRTLTLNSNVTVFKGGYGSVGIWWGNFVDGQAILDSLTPSDRVNPEIVCRKAYGKASFVLGCESRSRPDQPASEARLIDGVPTFLLKRMTSYEDWRQSRDLPFTGDVPDEKWQVLREEIRRDEAQSKELPRK